jgi:hypothetical protein
VKEKYKEELDEDRDSLWDGSVLHKPVKTMEDVNALPEYGCAMVSVKVLKQLVATSEEYREEKDKLLRRVAELEAWQRDASWPSMEVESDRHSHQHEHDRCSVVNRDGNCRD